MGPVIIAYVAVSIVHLISMTSVHSKALIALKKRW